MAAHDPGGGIVVAEGSAIFERGTRADRSGRFGEMQAKVLLRSVAGKRGLSAMRRQ